MMIFLNPLGLGRQYCPLSVLFGAGEFYLRHSILLHALNSQTRENILRTLNNLYNLIAFKYHVRSFVCYIQEVD